MTKRFGGTLALDRVSLEIPSGRIHALVGQNGAGKSTCLGLIAGKHAPTEGAVEVLGRKLTGGGPREARRAGVAAIYQELSVVPAMSAVANAFLGQEQTSRYGRLDAETMERRFEEACALLGVSIPPRTLVRDLSVALAQTIEIVRGVVSSTRMLLFDEPTTSLSDDERSRFFEVMGVLRERGLTQVLVSHNLSEVLAHADLVTVFHDGRVVDTRPTADWSRSELISAMVGTAASPAAASPAAASPAAASPAAASPAAASPTAPRRAAPGRRSSGAPSLEVRNLSPHDGAPQVSFSLGDGEILGLAGLMGSGRSSILRAIAGAAPRARGELGIGDARVGVPRSVNRARRLGIGYLPEDRKTDGLVLSAPAIDSMLLGGYDRLSRRGFLSAARCRELARDTAVRCRFDPQRIASPVQTLSGGNQQKVLLGRWVFCHPRVLLCDEPSRGVDVVARQEIWQTLHELAADGTSLLVVSSEFEEMIEHCDRILVVVDGRLVHELSSSEEQTSARILQSIFGHTHAMEVVS